MTTPLVRNAPQRSEMKSRHDAKSSKFRQTERDRKAAYRLVDIRDEGKCRACGMKTTPFHPDPAKRREHHHINGRGFKGAETTGNICLLCGDHHDLRHAKRTLSIIGNADQQLTFELDGKVWNG